MIRNSDVQHLGTKEVAFRLKVHPVTVAAWRVRGYGPPYIKTGKNVLYSVAALEAWEKSQTKRSTSDAGSPSV